MNANKPDDALYKLVVFWGRRKRRRFLIRRNRNDNMAAVLVYLGLAQKKKMKERAAWIGCASNIAEVLMRKS